MRPSSSTQLPALVSLVALMFATPALAQEPLGSFSEREVSVVSSPAKETVLTKTEPRKRPAEKSIAAAERGFSSLLADSGGPAAFCGSCETSACLGDCMGATSWWFASFEYMHWWNKGRSLPPLVTRDLASTPLNTGPPSFTPVALTVNNPLNTTAELLFGGEDVGSELQAGGRLTLGVWLDEDACHGLGGRFFANEGHVLQRLFSSSGSPALGRPYFNTEATGNAEDALRVARLNPTDGDNLSGSVRAVGENDVFGGDVFFRQALRIGCGWRLDVIAGYQFSRIDDDLLIGNFIRDNNADNTFDSFDLFDVRNEFHAGEFGLAAQICCGCWTLDMYGKIGYGNMRQEATISGLTSANGAPAVSGGLLAQATNIGVHRRDVEAWAPEASFKLSWVLTDSISISVGYTFFYWSNVALAGDQIDRNVSVVSGVATGPDPQHRFRDTDFWAQTIDIGATLEY